MSNTLFAKKFAADEPALITFKVRHKVTLDKPATEGISRQAFTEDDFSATIHETLLPTNDTNNFSNLFSPSLTVSRWKPCCFKNVGFQEKCTNLIIRNYHDLVFLIFRILLNYINRPIVGLSASATKELKEKMAYESSFSQRMRA